MLAQETITAVLEGPLCFIILWGMLNDAVSHDALQKLPLTHWLLCTCAAWLRVILDWTGKGNSMRTCMAARRPTDGHLSLIVPLPRVPAKGPCASVMCSLMQGQHSCLCLRSVLHHTCAASYII